MLCQKCGKNPANVYYRQNINGAVKEIALCSECMAEISGGTGNIGKFFGPGFMSALPELNLFGGLFDTPQRRTESGSVKACTLCGSTFREIAENGKIGCAKCYDTFRDELANTIGSIHGKVRHIGRAPKGQNIKRDKANKLRSLKAELKKAIDSQDFESAAKLRDQIRGFEKEEN